MIERIEHVVPPWVWLGLIAALMFASTATASAVFSSLRARREGLRLEAMSAAAITDPLTGALNRRGFIEALERELARARRYQRQFVLAYVDVRGLKAVNDTEGHRAGDLLLREAVELLRHSARADDVVGRIGGDELGIVLGEIGPKGAGAVTQRIQANVASRRETLGLQSAWDLTIGTASFPGDGQTAEELLRAADMRLYEQRGIALR